MVIVVAGALIGAVMARLVYLLATLLLTGKDRIPRTPRPIAPLLARPSDESGIRHARADIREPANRIGTAAHSVLPE